MVLKTWIADAKEAIYEAEDLLIEIDNEARRIELVAGSQTGMYQVRNKARSLHLMKQQPSHERVPSTSLLGHNRVYGRDQSKEAIKKLLLSDDAEGESLQVIPIVGMPGIGKICLPW
uniref:Rx N-terminal domain-containing protein n=1 Tax=Populus trichocarpa TaxID=3694 RepID=A0A2K1R6F4_POPTR